MKMQPCSMRFIVIFLFFAQPCSGEISAWHLTKEQGDAWIIGSIHAMRQDMYPLPSAMTDLISKVQVLAVEVNILELDAVEMQRVITETAMYPARGASLASELAPDTLEMLINHLKRNGLSMDQMRQLRPWFINLNIGVDEMIRLGFDPGLGIDILLMKQAKALGVKLLEIESFEQQMRSLAGDSAGVQEMALRHTLNNIEKFKEDLEEMYTYWSKGDVDGLYKVSIKAVAAYPELEAQFKRLIDHRNREMV
ncbi:MAG: TraB/GumN family protein, partial [Gammaproteobacteria bacterium]|nr:TraB/GumN family protein [Gammaproteobacteria bacterium]